MCILARHSKLGDYFLCLVQDRSDVQPQLSGYGVELSVKSTEYKAMDDSKVQGVVMTTLCHVTCITRNCLLFQAMGVVLLIRVKATMRWRGFSSTH